MFFSVLLTRKENTLPPITIPQNTATPGMTCPCVADDILLNIYRYGSVPREGRNLHCAVGGLRVASDLFVDLGRCTQRPYHAAAIVSYVGSVFYFSVFSTVALRVFTFHVPKGVVKV